MAALRTYDPKKAEPRWQRAWGQARLFEASARRGRPKWYSNVPYPYPDGLIHLGQGIAFLRAEFQSRYRRMAGYNVLHPQGFHCTGLPVVGAARRVAERDPKQIEVLRQMGVPDREIPRFADPLHWIDVFPRATMEDLQHLGAAIDWRRSRSRSCVRGGSRIGRSRGSQTRSIGSTCSRVRRWRIFST